MWNLVGRFILSAILIYTAWSPKSYAWVIASRFLDDEPANVDSEEFMHETVYGIPPLSFNDIGSSQSNDTTVNCDNDKII